MGTYEAIGMLEKMTEQIKKNQGFHAPSDMNDFQKLVTVVEGVVFMLRQLNVKIETLEKGAVGAPLLGRVSEIRRIG